MCEVVSRLGAALMHARPHMIRAGHTDAARAQGMLHAQGYRRWCGRRGNGSTTTRCAHRECSAGKIRRGELGWGTPGSGLRGRAPHGKTRQTNILLLALRQTRNALQGGSQLVRCTSADTAGRNREPSSCLLEERTSTSRLGTLTRFHLSVDLRGCFRR